MNPTSALSIELAAAYFGLAPRDVMSRRHSRAVTQARFAAWTALNLVHGWTCTEIEDEFDYDHTSILHGWDHSDAGAVEAVCEGLRAARHAEARRVAGVETPGTAGESQRTGIDLSRTPDTALPLHCLRAGAGVHDPVVPRNRKGRRAAESFGGAGVGAPGNTGGPGESVGYRYDGSENCFGTLGLLKSVVPSRTRLIEILRMHGARV